MLKKTILAATFLLSTAGVAAAQTADLGVSVVSLTGPTPASGTTLRFQIDVENFGPDDAHGLVTADLNASATWTCAALTRATCAHPSGQGTIGETDALLAGGKVTYLVDLVLPPDQAAPFNVAAFATATDATDPVAGNDWAASPNIYPLYVTDMSIAISDDRTTATQGDTLVYTITVSNAGPSLGLAVVEAPLPPELTLVSRTCVAGPQSDCAGGPGGPSIWPGSSVTYTVTAALAPTFVGTVSTTATVRDYFFSTIADDTETDTTDVVPPAPSCAPARASAETIGPPNHKLVPFTIEGLAGRIVITAVEQDEPVNGDDDGSTGPDAVLMSDGSARLRAERSGSGDGRVYHVSFQLTDSAGGVCTGEVRACVPLNKGGSCADGGALYPSN